MKTNKLNPKHTLLKPFLVFSIITFNVGVTIAQQIIGTIPSTQLSVWNKNLMGFNLGDFANIDLNNLDRTIFDSKTGGTGDAWKYTVGGVDHRFIEIENAGLGSNVVYRFYTGEYGNCYNRWYGGSGSTFRNGSGSQIFDPSSYSFHQIQYNQYYTDLDVTGRYNNYHNYATYGMTPSISYQTASPAKPDNNIIFPFIKMITNDRNKDGKAVFNLPINAHYRNYTKDQIALLEFTNSWAKSVGVTTAYANLYAPRLETFSKSSIIGTINSMNSTDPNKVKLQSLVDAGILSPQFMEIVKQNLDGFKTLIMNRVRVYHVELGNEISGGDGNAQRYVNTGSAGCLSGSPAGPTYTEFQTQWQFPFFGGTGYNTYNDKLFYYDPCNNYTTSASTLIQSATVYSNLCKMYIELIKELVNDLYTNENTDLSRKALLLDIKNNLKFGVSTAGQFPTQSDPLRRLNDFLFANKNQIGYDALIVHPYYWLPCVTTNPNDKDYKFDQIKQTLVTRFNTYYKTTIPGLLQTYYPTLGDPAHPEAPSELWFTEWAPQNPSSCSNPPDIANTLLEGMNYIDEFMSFLDFNSNQNTISSFRRPNLIRLANHQLLFTNNLDSKSEMIALKYNSSTVRYRTLFYAHKLLLPIMDNSNVSVVLTDDPPTNNGGFASPTSNVYFRSFVAPGSGLAVPDMPGYQFVNTLYIYYSNKDFNTSNVNAYFINLQTVLQPYLTSILPTSIYSVNSSRIYANKLYASRGLGPNSDENIYPTDLTKTVQIDDNVSIPNTSWTTLPIRSYSTGYYKIEIVRKTNQGGTGNKMKPKSASSELNKIYPNPLKQGDLLNVVINSDNETETVINIIDMEGKLVSKKTVYLVKGVNNLKMETNELSKGAYIVNDTNNNININFIVQ